MARSGLNFVVERRCTASGCLNGCNARILSLNIGRVPMYIIGAEGGLLPINPVATDKLVMPRLSGSIDLRLPTLWPVRRCS